MSRRIIKGCEYRYTGGLPVGCRGHHYLVEDFILDVPSRQNKVLVLALTGPDKGLRFSCTLDNFAHRYEVIQAPAPPERMAGIVPTGSGV